MQKKIFAVFMAAMRIAVGWHFLYEGLWKLMQEEGWSCASYLEFAQGPLSGLFKWMAAQGWIVTLGSYAVMWGLVAIGLALITGVAARIAALFGIALLAMFYAAQPPEPFATAMSGADGRFFLFERNAIEGLALAFIAVSPCWRGFVRTLLSGILTLAVFGVCFRMHYKAGGFKKVQTVTSATVKVHEFTALAALKAPFAERADIAGINVSRLALGGDLIAGRSHARDLIWTDEFMRRYNDGVTLGRTVRYCLHCGLDAVFADSAYLAKMTAAANEVGGKLAFFASCADAKDAAQAAAGGAKSVYLRPKMTDELAKKGDAAALKSLVAALRQTKLPVGVGAEDVATVRFCVENGVKADYWVLAFHSLDYPAARMAKPFNSIWCVDPKAAAEYMKTRPEPWVAIRCLAGGAINPHVAYKFAKENGATAAAIDLLDYRIVETVNAIIKDSEKAAKKGKSK